MLNRRRRKPNKPEKPKFDKIYYILQTTPVFKTCGQVYSKEEAEEIAKYVRKLTGQPGKVVEFTRKELKRLDFGKYGLDNRTE